MKKRRMYRSLYRISIVLAAAAGLFSGLKANRTEMAAATEAVQEKPSEPMNQMPVALTFDDGPHPVYTEKLLDGLKERNIKATFFVIGKNAQENPELVKRIREEGHLLGNHTYSHVALTELGQEEACLELDETCRVVEEITGEPLEYVRPPFGNWSKELECEISMIPILWTVDSRDWNTTNVAEIVGRVVTQTQENDIILMHDYYSTSVDAALQIVDQLTARGFEFVTADELIIN